MINDPLSAQEFCCLISHPFHLNALGSALRTYLWLWARIQKNDRTSGTFNGGRHVTLAQMAKSMGVSQRTISRDLAVLRDGDYLDSELEGRGFSGWVQIWDGDTETE